MMVAFWTVPGSMGRGVDHDFECTEHSSLAVTLRMREKTMLNLSPFHVGLLRTGEFKKQTDGGVSKKLTFPQVVQACHLNLHHVFPDPISPSPLWPGMVSAVLLTSGGQQVREGCHNT